MWKLASKRTPDMPMGSLMPCSLSTVNSWGMTSKICSPGCITSLRMSWMRASMSSWLISASRFSRVIMPRCWRDLMCCPAMPTFTSWIWAPTFISASSTACLIDATVRSMLATTPRDTPTDSLRPKPSNSIFPNSFLRPMKQAILVVPMSRPTTISPEGCACVLSIMGSVVRSLGRGR